MNDIFSKDWIMTMIVSIPGILLAISMHECAHGYAAYFMGDKTAKYSGRLSLNPLRHLDPIGTLCMLFFRFGWAKPVPINSRNFKDSKKGIILVSLAGPLANFIIGFISTLILTLILYCTSVFDIEVNVTLFRFLVDIFRYSALMNVGFMIFNLIPIPPLDGSKILMEFLPPRLRYQIYQYEQYFSIILIILVYAGFTAKFLPYLSEGVMSFYINIIELFSKEFAALTDFFMKYKLW